MMMMVDLEGITAAAAASSSTMILCVEKKEELLFWQQFVLELAKGGLVPFGLAAAALTFPLNALKVELKSDIKLIDTKIDKYFEALNTRVDLQDDAIKIHGKAIKNHGDAIENFIVSTDLKIKNITLAQT